MFGMKKIVSAALAVAMCASLSATAFASAPRTSALGANVSVINQSEHITEQAIQEIVNDVNASIVHADGTVTPLESVITIDDVAATGRSSMGDTYRVAVKSNIITDSDSKNREGVKATIHIWLTWTDLLGPWNRFDSVRGNIIVSQGAIRTSSVSYGSFGETNSHTTTQLGTKSSFNIAVNRSMAIPTALYQAYFKDATFELNVGITASPLD